MRDRHGGGHAQQLRSREGSFGERRSGAQCGLRRPPAPPDKRACGRRRCPDGGHGEPQFAAGRWRFRCRASCTAPLPRSVRARPAPPAREQRTALLQSLRVATFSCLFSRSAAPTVLPSPWRSDLSQRLPDTLLWRELRLGCQLPGAKHVGIGVRTRTRLRNLCKSIRSSHCFLIPIW